jgi:hypothetical protein
MDSPQIENEELDYGEDDTLEMVAAVPPSERDSPVAQNERTSARRQSMANEGHGTSRRRWQRGENTRSSSASGVRTRYPRCASTKPVNQAEEYVAARRQARDKSAAGDTAQKVPDVVCRKARVLVEYIKKRPPRAYNDVKLQRAIAETVDSAYELLTPANEVYSPPVVDTETMEWARQLVCALERESDHKKEAVDEILPPDERHQLLAALRLRKLDYVRGTLRAYKARVEIVCDRQKVFARSLSQPLAAGLQARVDLLQYATVTDEQVTRINQSALLRSSNVAVLPFEEMLLEHALSPHSDAYNAATLLLVKERDDRYFGDRHVIANMTPKEHDPLFMLCRPAHTLLSTRVEIALHHLYFKDSRHADLVTKKQNAKRAATLLAQHIGRDLTLWLAMAAIRTNDEYERDLQGQSTSVDRFRMRPYGTCGLPN